MVLWQLVPQDGAEFVSRFGELTGITDVRRARGVELRPDVTARQRGIGLPAATPGPTGAAGLDLRLPVAGSLTLNAAVNPDFGQLDGDPATLNLTPSETFFEERRPFFTEASDAFNLPLSAGGPEALVYSRRIGRAPQLAADDHGGTVAAPGETTILGAAKLTGKTRSGWNVGVLASRTAEEVATGTGADGRGFANIVEPATSYGALRLGRDLREGRTVVSGIATYVRRDLTPASEGLLRREAVVIGGDLLHRWGRNGAYRLRASLTDSRVAGSAEPCTDAAAVRPRGCRTRRYLRGRRPRLGGHAPSVSPRLAVPFSGFPRSLRPVPEVPAMPRRVPRVAVLFALAVVAACGRSAPEPAPVPVGPNQLTTREIREGWQLLFDGRTTSGWHNYGQSGPAKGWEAIDGALVRTGPGGTLVTDRQFGSFELELDWKVKPGGNSGILYWGHEASEVMYQNAPEYQVLDNAVLGANPSPLQAAGALYALYPAPFDAARPVGEWNHARIVTKGSHVEQWLNGVKTVDVDFDSKEMKEKIAASKFAQWPTFAKQRRGHLGLQDHSDSVWYRNIMIRERP